MRVGSTLIAVALLSLASAACAEDEAEKPEEKTVTTESGLSITELRPGTGEVAGAAYADPVVGQEVLLLPLVDGG